MKLLFSTASSTSEMIPDGWGSTVGQKRQATSHLSYAKYFINEEHQPANTIWKHKQATSRQTSVMILMVLHINCNFICSKICPTVARFPQHNRVSKHMCCSQIQPPQRPGSICSFSNLWPQKETGSFQHCLRLNRRTLPSL